MALSFSIDKLLEIQDLKSLEFFFSFQMLLTKFLHLVFQANQASSV